MHKVFLIEFASIKREIVEIYCATATEEEKVNHAQKRIEWLEDELYEKLRQVGKRDFLISFAIVKRIHKLNELKEMLKQCR